MSRLKARDTQSITPFDTINLYRLGDGRVAHASDGTEHRISLARTAAVTVPHHPKRLVPATQADVENIDGAIDALPGILGDPGKWVLSGGLAIDLADGRLTRKHFDLDIGVEEGDLPNIVASAGRAGYGLFKKVLSTKVSSKKKAIVYRGLNAEDAVRRRSRRLRLARIDALGKPVAHGGVLDYLDVYVHRKVGDEMHLNHPRITLPSDYNEGGSYTTRRGTTVRLRGIDYLKVIKERRDNPANAHDLEKISAVKKGREKS